MNDKETIKLLNNYALLLNFVREISNGEWHIPDDNELVSQACLIIEEVNN